MRHTMRHVSITPINCCRSPSIKRARRKCVRNTHADVSHRRKLFVRLRRETRFLSDFQFISAPRNERKNILALLKKGFVAGFGFSAHARHNPSIQLTNSGMRSETFYWRVSFFSINGHFTW